MRVYTPSAAGKTEGRAWLYDELMLTRRDRGLRARAARNRLASAAVCEALQAGASLLRSDLQEAKRHAVRCATNGWFSLRAAGAARRAGRRGAPS